MSGRNHDGRAGMHRIGWRWLSRTISASLSLAAIGTAVYLGATAPATSPVQPPAAALAPAPARPDGELPATHGFDGRHEARGDAPDDRRRR